MNRWIAAFIGIVVLILLLALYGYVGGRWEAQAQEPPSEYESRLIQLDKEAVEQAYREQIMHLFQTWMKDDRGQPERAVNGAKQARKAYISVMRSIDKRANR